MARTITAAQIAAIQAASNALVAVGMPAAFLQLALAQLAHETGGFTSRVMADNNNLSGIKFINNPALQKNASQGRRSPEGNYYASFASIEDWARDYIRIISRGANPPIQATSVLDLATRLKANGYYGDTVANYSAGLTSWYNTLSSVQYAVDSPSALGEKGKTIVQVVLTSTVILLIIIVIYRYKIA